MPSTRIAADASPRVALFAPHPLLSVTIEREGGSGERERVHFHAAGQGVWVARMVAAMGAVPVLCGFIGGESGRLLEEILPETIAPGEAKLVGTAAASGCYVVDRRGGEREPIATALSDPPDRHELDDLFSLTCAEAIACGWLVVTNPMPGDALPLEIYGDLVADAKANGAHVIVDLSPPRMQSALRGRPDVAKLNDWELAQLARAPVSKAEQLLAAAERMRELCAGTTIVTRGGQPALVLDDEGPRLLVAPRLERGFREGCGDAMTGTLAAAWALGEDLDRALIWGAAGGAANFLRRGLGSASREVVERLLGAVRLESWSEQAFSSGEQPLTTEA